MEDRMNDRVISGLLLFAALLSLPLTAQKAPDCQYDARKLAPAEIGTLGVYWYVTEPYGWSGVWTRRGSQQVYDARWKHTNGTVVTDVIRVIDWNPGTRRVSFFRDGNCGRYQGVIDLSKGIVQGGTASWYPAGITWSAKISNTPLQ